jgi:hypothetical protein
VTVFWCGNLVNAGPWTRGRHRPQVAWPTACPVCGVARTEPRFGSAARCTHRGSWVDSVPVADVVADALDLLDGAARG